MNRVGRFAIVMFTAGVCMLPFLIGAAEVRDRADAEVLEEFERCARIFHEIFGGR